MKAKVPSVVGLRQEDAIKILEAEGLRVQVRVTQPPRPRLKKKPASQRVIAQRETGEGIELIVTPEWIDWLPIGASENNEPTLSEAKDFGK